MFERVILLVEPTPAIATGVVVDVFVIEKFLKVTYLDVFNTTTPEEGMLPIIKQLFLFKPSNVIVFTLLAPTTSGITIADVRLYVPGATLNTTGPQIPPNCIAAIAASNVAKLVGPTVPPIVNVPLIAGAFTMLEESFPRAVSATLFGNEVHALINDCIPDVKL